jgi:hypothetical protein
MNIPSTLLDYDNDDLRALLRFLETVLLTSFVLGSIYWRKRSVKTTIAIHGLNNIALSLLFLFGVMPIGNCFSINQPFNFHG